jgi:G3E family GTPase
MEVRPMTAKIYIISGFLGAGKTTLIQKLLREALAGVKTVLVENDFGEAGIDAALLKSSGVEVAELNSGCICCSITGDFVKSLRELLKRFNPEAVLVEPSGVSKLSDVAAACADPSVTPLAELRGKITVVDVKRCRMYYDNFGEFFTDQIESADTILMSRAETYPEMAETAADLARSLNARAEILTQPWTQINAADLLRFDPPERPAHPEGCECGHSHAHGENHVHDENHAHSHAAGDVFEAVDIRTDRSFTRLELQTLAAALPRAAGTVLRAKGVVRGPAGHWNLQYLPGDWQIEPCEAAGGTLSFVGRDLNRDELIGLLGGESA